MNVALIDKFKDLFNSFVGPSFHYCTSNATTLEHFQFVNVIMERVRRTSNGINTTTTSINNTPLRRIEIQRTKIFGKL